MPRPCPPYPLTLSNAIDEVLSIANFQLPIGPNQGCGLVP